jgi:hypothetical protein
MATNINRNKKNINHNKSTYVQAKVETKSGTSIHEINLAHVQLPKFEQALIRTSVRPWVEYGDNNLFPDFLINCIDKSTRHSRYLNLRENCIKGGKIGLTYSDDIKEFLENIDGVGGTAQNLLNQWAVDLAVLETFACFVRYNKKGEIAAIDYIDSSKVRVAKPQYTQDELEAGLPAEINGYYISDDWSDILRNKPVYYDRFNPTPRNAKGDIVKPSASIQLFYYRKKALKQPYYPQLSYASCLNNVLAQEQLSLYGLNSLLNGMFSSSIIHMIAPNMSDEEQSMMHRKINQKFSGAENNSKSMLVVTEDEKATIDIKPLTIGDNTNLIESIRSQTEQAIDVAHGCRPELVGIPSNGGLATDGNSIGPSMEIYQNNVINALQAGILTFVHDVLRFNGYDKAKYELDIAENVLVKELSPQWFEEANIKRESLARKYGWKDSDLITIAPKEATVTVDDETKVGESDKAIDEAPGATEIINN